MLCLASARPCLTPASPQIKDDRIIRVLPPEADRTKQVFALQRLSQSLQGVIVQGIPTVERAVIARRTSETEIDLLRLIAA